MYFDGSKKCSPEPITSIELFGGHCLIYVVSHWSLFTEAYILWLSCHYHTT